MRRLLAYFAAALLAWAPCAPVNAQPAARIAVLSGGVPAGTPTALSITSSLFTDGTTPTDIAPVSQFVNGWTADLTLKNVTPAGSTGAYAFGTLPTSPNFTIPVTRHGYDSSANPTTTVEMVYATSWLRQPSPNQTLPTEGGTANLALTLSHFIYGTDTVSPATAAAGFYTGSKVSTRIPVTNASTLAYPRPIGAWITEPGLRYDGSTSGTVEFFGGQALAMGGTPLAAVNITLTDGTHSTSHLATLAQSARLLSTSCTATNGSNVLTACGSTAGFIVGERLTVPGVPGQPKIASIDSATQMTLGSTGTVTTTLNSATITVTNNTVPAGDGLGDGLFVGAKVNCPAVLNGGSDATIATEPVTAGVTLSSGKATQATWATSTATSTAATNTACTFKHVYQGSTGTVKVTLGNPVPTWQATFSAGEIAAMSDGAIWFRAYGYATVGDVVLDTQAGADGTGIDWQGQAFLTNGSDISPNLHNLFAYKDAAGNYAPRYAWTDGAGGGSVATQATNADPGAAAYYASLGAACAGLKTWYNANKGHNDANGGVVIVKTGASLAGVGTSMAACTVKAEPLLTVQNDPVAGPLTATITTGATEAIGPMTKFVGLIYSVGTTGLTGVDSAVTSTKLGTLLIFDRSKMVSTAAGIAGLWKVGAIYNYNNLIDQSAGDASFVGAFGTTSGSNALNAGNTLIGGTFIANKATHVGYNDLGNVAWGIAPRNPSNAGSSASSPNYVQSLSTVEAYNKWMGMFSLANFSNGAIRNMLFVNNVWESFNNSGGSPALRISGDANAAPLDNVFRHYETVVGERTNVNYQEGQPLGSSGTGVASGGSLAAGTYVLQAVYSLVGAPSVETATDGAGLAITVGGAGSGSITLPIETDPYHVVTIYISSVNSATPNHIATATIGGAGGTAASQIATNQLITITAVGASQTPTASLPGHNTPKTAFIERFVIDEQYNNKGDTYSNGGSNITVNGARVGSWYSRWGVSKMGLLAVTGSVINGPGPSPTSGLGEISYPYSTNGSAGSLALVKYKSDRSWGGTSATLISPALNLGQGNYCVNTASITNPLNRVPSGYAAWPIGIDGAARLNDGTGAAGAYEQGCL